MDPAPSSRAADRMRRWQGAPLTAAQYPVQVQSGAQTILDGVAAMFGSSASPMTVQQLTQEIIKEYPLSDFASPDEKLPQAN